MDESSAIAIVGAACRAPEAPDTESLWENLRSGRDCVRFFEPDEIDPDYAPLARDARFVRAGAIVEGIDLFDAAFFRMSPREAVLVDPQHRLMLEAAWTALEDAGYGDPSAYRGAVGVYAGSWASTYGALAGAHARSPSEEFQALVGTGLDYLATFVSYKLGLTGESIAVQTACSTSLVAVHLACQSLQAGSVDLAIAGGVSIDAKQKTGYLYQEGMIFSPDGRCRPFDHRAQGTVRGYGLGVVVLKRLEDAVRDRDPIRAVILATAVNNDGRDKVGYTAPSVRGQASAIASALAMAGVEAESIGYVEAHGTGTPLGDPIEIEALTRAFDTSLRGFCRVGSVKSNVGHLVEAAGAVGLIKTVLSLEHGELAPTLHFDAPNPRIRFEETPFRVADRAMRWDGPTPLRAGVSSFGIGGTNAHVIVEAAPSGARAAARIGGPCLITLSAETPDALSRYRAALARWLGERGEERITLADLAYTLGAGRKAMRERWALVAGSIRELRAALVDAAAGFAGTAARHDGGAVAVRGDKEALARAASAWIRGAALDWTPLASAGARRRSIPTYRFERMRFWPEAIVRTAPRGMGPWLGQGVVSSGADGVSAVAETAGAADVLLLAAPSADRLAAHAAALAAMATRPGTIADLCFAASRGACDPHRAAVVADARDVLAARLRAVAENREEDGVWRGEATSAPRLVFVFSGQGGQWSGMGRELLRDEPVFAAAFHRCAEALRPLTGWSAVDELTVDPSRSRIHATDVAQPLLFALQVGLSALLGAWGAVPDAVVGHSVGEVAAAHVAGALTLEDAARVVHHRSRLMRTVAGTGRTAVVALGREEAERAIGAWTGSVGVAGANSPEQTVLSGEREALADVLASLTARGVYCRELDVDVAFHGPAMEPLVSQLEASLAGLEPSETALPFFSSVVADTLPGAELGPTYWSRNLRDPFSFSTVTQLLARRGYDTFLEIGPHPILGNAIAKSVASVGARARVLPTLRRKRSDGDGLRRALAELHVIGTSIEHPAPSAEASAAPPAIRDDAPSQPQRVRALVARCLGMPSADVPADAPLVDLGLDSVGALSLIAAIREGFDVALSVGGLLRAATLSGITALVERRGDVSRGDGGDGGLVVPLHACADASVRVVMFPGAGGTAMMEAPWARVVATAGHVAVDAIDPRGRGTDERAPLRSMPDAVASYADALASAGGERPLVLLGFSLGGLVAYAVALELERRGRPAAGLILSHTLPPTDWRERRFSADPRFDEIFGALHDAQGLERASRAAFVDAARADFELAESFVAADDRRVRCAVAVIGSGSDEHAPGARLREWGRFVEDVAFHDAKGGHFDFLDHVENRALLRRAFDEVVLRAGLRDRNAGAP